MSDIDRKANENRLKGLGKEIEGKLRNAAGAITGDASQQLEGKAQELKGKVQRKIGDAQDELSETNKQNRNQP